MKTPDEIKKGLECCTIPLCAVCPYDGEESCIEKNNEDALTYMGIQLEANELQRTLNTGERHEQEVTLQNLKSIYTAFGMEKKMANSTHSCLFPNS